MSLRSYPALPLQARAVVDGLPAMGALLQEAVTRRHAAAGAEQFLPRGRPAAVLVLLAPAAQVGGERPGPGPGQDAVDAAPVSVVLAERADGLRAHPGQVSFPGGSLEESEAGDVVAAALRESREEVGAPGPDVQVLGTLPAVPVPPRFVPVTPVLAWEAHPAPLVPAAAEVASTLRVRLDDLADPGARHSVRTSRGWVGPAFVVGDLTVWGFTALVLDCLLAASRLERTWDAGRVLALPERFASSGRPSPAARARRPAAGSGGRR